MIRSMVQTALDTALYPHVRTYWQRKSGVHADEYIVYMQAGDTSEAYADDKPLVKNANITVKYYYRAEKISTHIGREAVKKREEDIQAALEGAGFDIPYGKFDAGDVDDIGFFVTAFECEYGRVV